MQIQNTFLTQKKHFFKMHGTGNDFILINGIGDNILSNEEAVTLGQKLCHRKFGIGADGLLIVRQVKGIYKMQVVNSDGSLPKMCGNGLRCFVSLLYHLKMIPNNYTVQTDDGQKSINIHQLPKQHPSFNKQFMVTLKIGKGGEIQQFTDEKYGELYLTTIGVPHVVVFLSKQQFQVADFQLQGKQIQKKHNANINFCFIDSISSMKIKTYERGAGLTYSCGTGVSSSVYVAINKHKIASQPVLVNTDGGQIQIQVTESLDVVMNGPAKIICEGTFNV